MIDHLRQMAIFARVVDEGSFRGAATDIGVAPSRVSQSVSDLEAYLGVKLLSRSTRKIALTNEGRMLYRRVTEMMHSAETGLNELNAMSLEPVGALRVSLPAFMASSTLSTAIVDFVAKYPNVAVSVNYTDHQTKLVEDGYDVNVRAGWLDDSSLMSKKLGESARALVAGTEYTGARKIPHRPSDMEEWDWIRYLHRADTMDFTSSSGETESVTGNAQLEVDSVEALYHFATCNAGATVLPEHLAARGEAAGKLVRLLPDWHLRPLGFYAIWSGKSRRETLAQLFARYLATRGVC